MWLTALGSLSPGAVGQQDPFVSPYVRIDEPVFDAVAGYFNEDAALDLVICTGTNYHTVFLMAGNGDGTFGLPKHMAYLGNRAVLAAADFDGDGFTDVAAAQQVPGVLHILLGKPGGTLTLTQSLPLSGDPGRPCATNLDGDADLDLLLYTNTKQVVSMFNDGHGVFASPSLLPVGPDATSVAFDDVTGDGLIDLIIPRSTADLIEIRAGDGAGGFAAGYHVLAPDAAFAFTGDCEGDGDDDLVVYLGLGELSLLLNDGDGHFQRPVPLVVEDPFGLHLFDLNEDGADDIVSGWESLKVKLANGSGGFAPAVSYGGYPVFPYAVVDGDFNGDGDGDVFLACSEDQTRFYSVLAGRGDGTLRPVFAGATAKGYSYDLAAGDLDHDGNLDLVTAGGSSSAQLVVFPGLGNGWFGPPSFVPSEGVPRRFVLADLDEDGDLDCLVGSTALVGADSTLSLQRGLGTLGFGAPTVLWAPAQPYHMAVAAGDVDLDGHLDVVATSGPRFAVLLGHGSGGFSKLPDVTLPGGASEFALQDFTGDGLLDAVVAFSDPGPAVGIMAGLGHGRFSPPTQHPFDDSVRRLAAADLDQDGDVDLACASGPSGFSGTLTILLNEGGGTFASAASIELLPPTISSLAILDFDRDGVPDVATAGLASFAYHDLGRVDLWRGVGAGQFLWKQRLFLPPEPRGLVAADLSGDGATDLAVSQGPSVLVNTLGPWKSQGFALAGTQGLPKLEPGGPLAPASKVTFDLTDAAPRAPAWMVSGLAAAALPFKGGVLVPAPQVVVGPATTDAEGDWNLSTHFPPAVAPAPKLFHQVWIQDPAGPAGFAASNAVVGVTP